MQVTWKMLLTCREFAELAADARSIAEHERPALVRKVDRRFMIFIDACRPACHRFGCESLERRSRDHAPCIDGNVPDGKVPPGPPCGIEAAAVKRLGQAGGGITS